MPVRKFPLFALAVALILWAGAAWAAEAHGAAAGGGFEAWVHKFNIGAGALVLNPIIILIQWANFVVLLIILNKILYKPLWGLMNGRSGKIAGDNESAQQSRCEAKGYISQYEDSLAEIQRENTEALVRMEQEMTEKGRRRFDDVRGKTSAQIAQARAAIAAEAEKARGELRGRIEALAASIANRLAGRKVA